MEAYILKTEYDVIVSTDLKTLIQKVNDMNERRGFRPIGGICVAVCVHYATYYQSMVRTVKEEE